MNFFPLQGIGLFHFDLQSASIDVWKYFGPFFNVSSNFMFGSKKWAFWNLIKFLLTNNDFLVCMLTFEGQTHLRNYSCMVGSQEQYF